MHETWVRSLGWEDLLEKGTTTHSSILAFRLPWTEEPCRIQSMGLQRVRHHWVTFRSRQTFEGGTLVKYLPANAGDTRDASSIFSRSPGAGNSYPPTPIFLPGKFHGQRSLAGYSPSCRKESDTAEHNNKEGKNTTKPWKGLSQLPLVSQGGKEGHQWASLHVLRTKGRPGTLIGAWAVDRQEGQGCLRTHAKSSITTGKVNLEPASVWEGEAMLS